MGGPLLQEDAGDRDLPCRVAPLQSTTAFVPADVVDQHPYSGTNLVGHGSHAWKTSGARFRRMNLRKGTLRWPRFESFHSGADAGLFIKEA